jgi:hypothetical protein
LTASPSGLPRRPISVVLLQVLILVAVLMFVPPLIPIVYDYVPMGWRRHPVSVALVLLEWFTVLTLVVFIFWALWRRQAYAKWLGLGCIAVLAISAAAGFFDDRNAMPEGFTWWKAATLVALAGWSYAFAFSRKARAFFDDGASDTKDES